MKHFVKYSLIFSLFFSCSPQQEKHKTGREEYIGNWRVTDEQGKIFFITLHENGTATSTWQKGDKGIWKLEQGKSIITWSSGWTNILFKEEGQFQNSAYPPNTPVQEHGTNQTRAMKVEALPFLGYYQVDRPISKALAQPKPNF